MLVIPKVTQEIDLSDSLPIDKLSSRLRRSLSEVKTSYIFENIMFELGCGQHVSVADMFIADKFVADKFLLWRKIAG